MTQIAEPQQRTKNGANWAGIIARLGPVIALAVVYVLFASLSPSTFLTLGNLDLMLRQTAVVAMAAIGMTMIIITGGIDLSFGSTMALSTVVVATLIVRGFPPALAAVGGVLAGALCGLMNGLMLTRLKLVPFIVTLGTMEIYRGMAKGLAGNTMVYPDHPTWLSTMLESVTGKGYAWMLLPMGVWSVVILAILIAAVLRYTRFGRHIFAIGSSEATARLCGVSIERQKLLVYTLGATFAGLAGVLQFGFISGGDPTTLQGGELKVIAAVVIGGASLSGGQGSILGTLIGALVMTVVSNGCTKVGLENWTQQIVTGVLIVLAVALDRLRNRKAA